jgi:hypothetical protein
MQEKVTRFFIDLFPKDGRLLSLLDADHTFVNGPSPLSAASKIRIPKFEIRNPPPGITSKAFAKKDEAVSWALPRPWRNIRALPAPARSSGERCRPRLQFAGAPRAGFQPKA